MHIMHVQVLRRGHGILIEVIDVGLLADVAFIGAMHIMPANHDEWLPPVDGFFDLVRNPQGGAVMRPWYESFDGVPVIELCLRGILAGTMPTMPIPTAPPAAFSSRRRGPPRPDATSPAHARQRGLTDTHTRTRASFSLLALTLNPSPAPTPSTSPIVISFTTETLDAAPVLVNILAAAMAVPAMVRCVEKREGEGQGGRARTRE